MRVLEPKEMAAHRKRHDTTHHKRRRRHFGRWLIVTVVAVYVLFALLVPAPTTTAVGGSKTVPAKPVSMPWPSFGQAAVGAVGYGLLSQNGEPKPMPTASVAKVITAVAVLKVKPISAGTQGGTITITQDDVDAYTADTADGQSTVKVEAGETLTEYQALQALLLPSANNMADILAKWAFGSKENYLAFVNPFTKTLGMTNTTMADASGYSPKTVSTAVDLTKLAEIAMNNPMLSDIVNQSDATLPVAGQVFNVNRLVGHDGVVGIKTGNTDEAGGCFMFSARRQAAGQTITVVGTVVGAPSLAAAIESAIPLLDETYKNFVTATPVLTGDTVGVIKQRGQPPVPMLVREGLSAVVWNGQPIDVVTVPLPTKRAVQTGDAVGTVTVHIGNMTYPLTAVAGQPVGSLSVVPRLLHAGGYL